jgi:hypothetical protein
MKDCHALRLFRRPSPSEPHEYLGIHTSPSDALILCNRSPPCRPTRSKVVVHLFQCELGSLRHQQESADHGNHRQAEVEVSDISAHITVLLSEHIRRPKLRREAKGGREQGRIGLSIRAEPHRMHLG